jgi:Tfp pilus assembly protein PilX
MRVMPTSLPRLARFRRRQGGAVLLMAMLIVVLILMTGITATSNSNAQLKLAGAFQSEDIALNNAERAIVEAEAWLGSGTHGQSAGFAEYDPQATPHLLPMGFRGAQQLAGEASNATPGLRWPESGAAASAIGVAGNPAQQYVIAQLSGSTRLPGSSQVVGGRSSSGCNQVDTYQITARGRDPQGAARFVQTHFSVLHCPD